MPIEPIYQQQLKQAMACQSDAGNTQLPLDGQQLQAVKKLADFDIEEVVSLGGVHLGYHLIQSK